MFYHRPVNSLAPVRLRRRHLLCLALAGAAAPCLPAVAAADPTAPVLQLCAALAALMRLGAATPFRQRYHQIAPIIDRVFDLQAILRTSVGARWAALDGATQAALHHAFRRFTVATYVASFDKYDGEQFEVAATTRQAGADQVVQTHILRGSAQPIRLDYVMRQSDDMWRVVDILIDGTISRVAVQRSDFRGLLAHGDAAALIASLQDKAVDLAGGSTLDS